MECQCEAISALGPSIASSEIISWFMYDWAARAGCGPEGLDRLRTKLREALACLDGGAAPGGKQPRQLLLRLVSQLGALGHSNECAERLLSICFGY